MNALILTSEQLTQLQALNASGDPARRLDPVQLEDGRWALNADLLGDSAPGQTWEHYRPLLETLPAESVPAFPETNLE